MRFGRVTYSAFADDVKKFIPYSIKPEKLFDLWNEIELPKRSTQYSAGYDIKTPLDVTIPPHSSVKVPSGIKAIFNADEMNTWCLLLYIRSSVGAEGVVITHGTSVIDADYQFAKNDGDMLLALTNMSDVLRQYKPGDRICQAVFEIYGVTSDDDASGTRTGGVGSTGK